MGGGRGLACAGEGLTNEARGVCVTLARPGARARPANTSDLTLGTLPSGLTSGPENRVTECGESGTWAWTPGRGDTKLILLNWLRSNSTFLLPCFLFFSNLFGLLLLPLANFAVFKFALTLGFFPSALINGGLSKGFTIGSSVTSSTTSLSSIKGGTATNDLLSSWGGGLGRDRGLGVGLLRWFCLMLDFTLGLALKGRLVVVKPRGMGRGVVAEREERTSSSCK